MRSSPHRRPAFLALAAALLAVSSQAISTDSVEARPLSQAAIKSMDAAIADMVAKHKVAGYAVAIAKGDRIEFLKTYGMADIENGAAVTPDTVFRVGSITKQFTAAGILLLADRGKLSIYDPLSKYLPDYPNADKVSLYQILTHTSGLTNYTGLEFFESTKKLEGTTSEMTKALASITPQFEFTPGTARSYTNTGYFLLGAVIEKVSGQDFAEFMRANVFEPLGLKNTAIDSAGDIVLHRAHGYVSTPEAPSGFRNAPYDSLTVAGAAGAARSTIRDMVAWNAALLSGKLLKPATVALMTSPAKLASGRSAGAEWLPKHQPLPRAPYGLGLGLADSKQRPMVGHGGAISGFNAALFTYPDPDFTLVILGNTKSATYQFAPLMVEILLSGASAPPPAESP
ncbi:serine hydrolase domain-containing protein [Sphingosinicella rhizophila]|uniref:Serine hydrolase domain-containing protein n=1 Tax=Sphingosinicella rhizophila TaxID=3050082 RepID=A0ABU3QAT9_9SPHN|nr:serine hydrolase domain-containing protein [Sphingosinicella sp. GR2756]MDT9600521.1 serine hydrolase domain-containing protein [Sphingosinicella sp. GR2756]